ncbi:MAG: hypothetical protein LBJ08_02135 [Bifidobacteriaceae bacterium]|jgi:hypothetical protein|nr:hypothetical protein [Bifidobacteriaceae bacterium]
MGSAYNVYGNSDNRDRTKVGHPMIQSEIDPRQRLLPRWAARLIVLAVASLIVAPILLVAAVTWPVGVTWPDRTENPNSCSSWAAAHPETPPEDR